ncbi:MAG: 5-bromo-4-chloroindolyl phosphate hydrolysis family protein [Pseudomonadota bacterium]
MAQRYGGKFSPDGSPNSAPDAPKMPRPQPYAGARPKSAGARTNILFVAPLVLVFSLFGGGAVALAMNLGAMGLMLLSAWLTREGLKAEEAYNARTIAKPPALPRKMIASVLMGLGLALASFAASGIVSAVLIGVIGAALHGFAFGVDPMKSKGAEGIDQFQQDRVARVVDEAESHLTAMSSAISRVGDRQLEGRVERFQATARQMFRTVEEDPRDLAGARKFLGVYLMGAKDAAIKFADLYSKTRDAEAKAKFTALLDDLDANFAAKTEKLLTDNHSDMDVEIKVLRDRLKREGVRTE